MVSMDTVMKVFLGLTLLLVLAVRTAMSFLRDDVEEIEQ